MWFGVNVDQFETTGNTPIWVNSSSSLQDARTALAKKLHLQDSSWIPVTLKRGVEYPEMLDGVVDSLKNIADAIEEVGLSAE